MENLKLFYACCYRGDRGTKIIAFTRPVRVALEMKDQQLYGYGVSFEYRTLVCITKALASLQKP